MFDVRTYSSPSQTSNPLTKLFDVASTDTGGSRVMDIAIASSPQELFVVTDIGEVFRAYNRPHQKFTYVHRLDVAEDAA